MFTLECATSFSDEYVHLTELIMNQGVSVHPRSFETREIRPFVMELYYPLRRVVTVPFRKNNTFFNIVEAIWILAGREDVKPLADFASNVSQFSDDGLYFHAPYGARLRSYGESVEHKTFAIEIQFTQDSETKRILGIQRSSIAPVVVDQLYKIVEVLESDRNSRQAVAAIWNPLYDLGRKSKDIPCNDLLMFKIRDGALHLSVTNRSNDHHWGLLTNVFQFSFILDVMACVLNVGIGHQLHHSDSLHIYLNEYSSQITDRILKNKFRTAISYEDMSLPPPIPFYMNEPVVFNSLPWQERYKMTFEAIEATMLAIEDFDNMMVSTFRKDSIESNVLFMKVKKHSEYLYGLLLLAFSYALFKKAKSLLLEKVVFPNTIALASDFLFCSWQLLRDRQVRQEDLRVSCMNFYLHQLRSLHFLCKGTGGDPFVLVSNVVAFIKHDVKTNNAEEISDFILEAFEKEV